MIRNKVSIERIINERHYQFICPTEASLSEVASVIDDIKKYVMERISEAEKSYQEKECSDCPEEKTKSGCR